MCAAAGTKSCNESCVHNLQNEVDVGWVVEADPVTRGGGRAGTGSQELVMRVLSDTALW